MNKGCQRKLKKNNSIILGGFQDVEFFFPHSKWVGEKKKKIKTLKFWRLLNSNSFWFEALCFNSWQISLQCHELFTLSIVTCIRNRVISNTNQNTNTVGKFRCTVSSQPSPKFYDTFPKKEDLLKSTLSWGCIQLQDSGILVKNSQSAQMPTKETPSYFNQIKWILIHNAIPLVFHVNSILKQFQCSTTDSHRLAKWLHCVLINTNADNAPLGIKYWTNEEAEKTPKIRSRLDSKFCQK